MTGILNPLGATTIPILEKVINFAQTRHNILAGNVANADTPGYQVRDLSVSTFRERLSEMVEAKHSRYTASGSDALFGADSAGGHSGEIRYDSAMREVDDSTRTILFHDRSDVGMEQQVLQVSKNQSMHNMAIAIMQNQVRMLNVAISERI